MPRQSRHIFVGERADKWVNFNNMFNQNLFFSWRFFIACYNVQKPQCFICLGFRHILEILFRVLCIKNGVHPDFGGPRKKN